MPVRLNGATSGYTELSAPAVAGITTMTMPTASGTLDRLERSGNILQVVQNTFTSTTNSTSTSFVDTGLSVTITPTSSSSKIFIMTSFLFGQRRTSNLTQDHMKSFTLLRGSTNIAPANNSFFQAQNQASGSINFAEQTQVCAINYLDSPSTTSATTYKVQMKTDNSAVIIWFNSRGNGDGDHPGTSTIIAMEVAA
ncbi:hypothetical protein [Synechococcus phage S-B05]|nr:hypothetical protein [Synechococcus phage S-B05]